MKKIESQNKVENFKEEIDILELLNKIWDERKTIYKATAIFFVIGFLVAIGSINMYKSEAKLLPEVSDKEGGVSGLMKQFGSLTSLAGIDVGTINSTDAIFPSLYPDIVQSTPFMINILNTQIKIPSLDTTVTFYYYLSNLKKTSPLDLVKKYTIGLPGTIKALFTKDYTENKEIVINDGPIRMSLEMSKTIESLKESILLRVDLKSGIIIISAEFPDPEVAAQIAEKTVLDLTNYISEYRIQKVKDNLRFVSEQCEIAKNEFNIAQMNLALFQDKNKNIISSRVTSEKDRLQSEYDLTFNIYNTLSHQKEQSKIKVQEETPVFKVLSPVQVPIEKSKPKRSLIIIFMAFTGVIVGTIIVSFKNTSLLTFKKN